MSALHRRTFLASLAGVATSSNWSELAAVVPVDSAQTARIDQLIKKLGARRYHEREAASQQLRKIGDAALPALRRAANQTTDPEVRRRARQIIAAIDRARQPAYRCLFGHDNAVGCVAFAPDGRHVASGSEDGTVRVWGVHTGRLVWKSRTPLDCVRGVAWLPGGQQLVSASWDHTIRLWDGHKGKEVSELPRQSHPVRALAVSASGPLIAWGSNDKMARVWNLARNREVTCFRGHHDAVTCVALSRDGRLAASAARGSREGVRIWDAHTGKELAQHFSNASDPKSIAFAPDSQTLVSADGGPDFAIWDTHSGKHLRSFSGPRGMVLAVAFSPDGQRVLSGHDSRDIILWDVRTGKDMITLSDHRLAVCSVAFSPDGRYAASGSKDRTVRLWRLPP